MAPPDGKFIARRSEKAGVTPFGPKSVIIITALSLVLEMSVIKLCRAKGTTVGVGCHNGMQQASESSTGFITNSDTRFRILTEELLQIHSCGTSRCVDW